jgi:hypothetical protein
VFPDELGFNSNSPPQQQIKRIFKTKSVENALGSHRNLHLEEGAARKKSEVQMYMILYYDDRIREIVVRRWAEDRVPSLESRVEVPIPEDQIDPQDSFTMKDPKIPITYKTAVAQELYNAEPEVIKANVRSHREAYGPGGKTVRTDDEDERLTLVREYQRYVCGGCIFYLCLT